MTLHPVLLLKLNEAVLPRSQRATRRDVQLPAIGGKVHAVIGMRRSGKTTFLHQLADERRATLRPEQVLYINFDDDRLADIGVDQLSALLEEHYRRHPELRGREPVLWLFDEIQLVEGWERFVRRILDTEHTEVVVSGSSAKMLSREVHTSLRGRGIDTEVLPFSFREHLRHRGEEIAKKPGRWTSSERSRIERAFRGYLLEGGFPEAQGLATALRTQLLQGYVDTVMFRDVVERHDIRQVAALRWVVRHCLRNPASSLSVHKIHQDLKAQGHALTKDSVHTFLGHVLDAFLVSVVPVASESLRRQNSNPRKVYPIDHGLIGAFDPSGRSNIGHVLEVLVHNELRRSRAEISYVKTSEGFEVDFLVRGRGGDEQLIQVCSDTSSPATLERELRALAAAGQQYPNAQQKLLVFEHDVSTREVPEAVTVESIPAWLLRAPETD